MVSQDNVGKALAALAGRNLAQGLAKIAQLPDASQQEGALKLLGKDTPLAQRIKLLEATAGRDPTQHSHLLSGIAEAMQSDTADQNIAFLEGTTLAVGDRAVLWQKLRSSLPNKEQDKWLAYLARSEMDPSQMEQATTSIMKRWAKSDFNAAGAWINQQPQGPQRNMSIQTFAQTIAPHEPEAAATWALQLPGSDDKTTLLRTIRTHWLSKDPTAEGTVNQRLGILE